MKEINDFLMDPNLNVEPSKLDSFIEYIQNNKLENEIINKEVYDGFLKKFVDVRGEVQKVKTDSNIEIVKMYKEKFKKRNISDWVKYYNSKFEKVRDLLIKTREELDGVVSIRGLKSKNNNEKVRVIGMIFEVITYKTGGKAIILEDPTGTVRCSLRNVKQEYFDEIVLDEVVGVIGTKYNDSITVEKVIFPDIPENPLVKIKDDVYSCYTSDIHIGSKTFLEDKFLKFIKWLRGEEGDPALRKIAEKTKYVFVLGDTVDGVGVFPHQKRNLQEQSIYKQYDKLHEYLKMIPKNKQIIMIPGDHDATRLAEPQPQIPREFAEGLYSMDNVTMLSNPSMVRVHKTDDSEGYLNLLYHGNSVIPYVQDIPSLREKGMEKADWALHFLLRKRHLAPSHGLSRIAPYPDDYLFIDKVPNVFAIGHVHFCDISRYKQTITLTSSCWQDKTEHQEKLGLSPHPAIVPLLSMKEGKMVKLRFDKGHEQELEGENGNRN